MKICDEIIQIIILSERGIGISASYRVCARVVDDNINIINRTWRLWYINCHPRPQSTTRLNNRISVPEGFESFGYNCVGTIICYCQYFLLV